VARASAQAAATRKKSSGPSGSTQVPNATAKTGEMFSAATAHTAARAPNSRLVSPYISAPVPANSSTKGRRTMKGECSPVSRWIVSSMNHEIGGWSKYES
jgi:hypothetical protein